MGTFKVLIVGGGLGGLCLAQGLKKAGIECEVFERDRSKTDRTQGYRIGINPDGSRALHACLPADLFKAFDLTCGVDSHKFAFLTEGLEELLTMPRAADDADGVGIHRSVSRDVLRQVLLGGLDDIVRFDKKFARYEQTSDGKVTVYFEDGTSASGDLLVGADGVNSGVRSQFLPGAAPVDTGRVGVAGKIRLTDEVRALMSPACLSGAAVIKAPRGRSMFVARQDFPGQAEGHVNPERPAWLPVEEASYVVWGFFAKRKHYPVQGDLRALEPEALLDVVLGLVDGWHPRLLSLIRKSDLSALYAWSMRAAPDVEPWESTNVTLIGDAIHSMPPTGGVGGNTALRDACELVDRLASVSDRSDLVDAVRQYEAGMFKYAFDAVRSSMGFLRRATNENAIQLTASRVFFRTVNRVPALKRAVFS